MRGFRIRPSYANAVATVALFVALGGTAIATHPGGQNTISTADIQNGEVKVADIGHGAVATDELANGQVKAPDIGQGAVATDEIANGQVKAADIGDGEVKAAEIATDAVKAAEIATGAVRTAEIQNGQVQAEDLAPGVAPGASGARAWGLVSAAGTLLRSKQVTSVTNPSNGIYCIDPAPGIDPTTAVMVVGEDSASNGTSVNTDNVSHVEWDSNAFDCPAGTMEVRTFLGFGSPASGGELDLGGFDLGTGNLGFTFVIP